MLVSPQFFATFCPGHTFIITMTVGTGRKRAHRQTNLTVSESEHVGLVQRACSDPDAFARLYLMHYDNVFRYCVRRLFDRHSAEDVTSTVFFKVMHNLGSFDGTAIDFRSWLLRIAANAVNDHLRDARRRTEAIGIVLKNSRAESDLTIDCDQELLESKDHVETGSAEPEAKVPDCHHVAFFRKYEVNRNSRMSGRETFYGTLLALSRNCKTAE